MTTRAPHFHGDSCTDRQACVDAMVDAIFNDGAVEQHIDHVGCFCRPKKTYTDPVTNTEVWVHRYEDD